MKYLDQSSHITIMWILLRVYQILKLKCQKKRENKSARFDRKVERTKKSFEFTQKEKIVETNKDVFKKNFTFKWVQLNIKTVCVFLVDFLLVTLLIIPFMMQYLNATLRLFQGMELLQVQ